LTTDPVKCGKQRIKNAEKCGKEFVPDEKECGKKWVTDATTCGSDVVTSGEKCGEKYEKNVTSIKEKNRVDHLFPMTIFSVVINNGWLVVWNLFYFSIYWEFPNPN
jgi:hypothetical protein